MEFESYSVLVFSINKPTATFDFVDLALSKFLDLKQGSPFVIIADTLRAEPVSIIEKKSKKSAIATCTKLGDVYEEFLRESFKKRGIEMPVYRWKDLIELESYNKLYITCWEIAKSNPNVLQKVEALAMSHLKKRFPDKIWKTNAITASIDFLLQEMPLFCKIIDFEGKQIKHVFYPTIADSDLVSTLRDIVKQEKMFEERRDVGYTQILIRDESENMKIMTK